MTNQRQPWETDHRAERQAKKAEIRAKHMAERERRKQAKAARAATEPNNRRKN